MRTLCGLLALSFLAGSQAIDVDVGGLLQLLLTNKLNLTALLTPDLSAFNWSAAGPYTATGTASFALTWPFVSNATAPIPVTLAVNPDPVSGYVTISFPPRYQYVVPLGFYFVDASGCYNTPTKPTNYTHYQLVYQQLRQTEVHLDLLNGIVKTYSGLVIDPAFGGDYGSFLIQTNQKNQVIAYGFQQAMVRAGIGNTKTSGTLLFTQFQQGLPNPKWSTLPATCDNATVKDYDAEFYPSPPYFYPYPV